MGKNSIRLASEADAEEILEIYKPYLKETSITFEYTAPSVCEFGKRIRDIGAFYPYLVCVSDGKIIGYAYSHRYQERAAYQWNAELSVYVDKAYMHCGIGKALYATLIEILKLQNIQNLYGNITLPNDYSVKLHENFGFHQMGIYQKTGYKNGAWRDVLLAEKSIGDHEVDPKPIKSIKEIDEEVIAEILNRYCNRIKPFYKACK